MLEILLPYLGIILDVGNIIFFAVNFPQLMTAYKNRKELKGLSGIMLAGYMIATLFFLLAGLVSGGYIAATLCTINEIVFGCQLYWKRKYR